MKIATFATVLDILPLRRQTTEQWQRHTGVTIGEIDPQRAFNKDMIVGLEVDAVAGTVRRPSTFLAFNRMFSTAAAPFAAAASEAQALKDASAIQTQDQRYNALATRAFSLSWKLI